MQQPLMKKKQITPLTKLDCFNSCHFVQFLNIPAVFLTFFNYGQTYWFKHKTLFWTQVFTCTCEIRHDSGNRILKHILQVRHRAAELSVRASQQVFERHIIYWKIKFKVVCFQYTQTFWYIGQLFTIIVKILLHLY